MLEDILNIPITSTSYFPETPLGVASTVTVIPRQDWEKRGARRFNDALLNLPSVVALPNFLAQDSVRIRGYALSDARGIATLWDGVSITSFSLGTSDVDRPNIQLSTLGSIEVIRGPGSSLYGSDALHGVVALNFFEADKDINIIKARAASNGFYTTGYNGSTGVGTDWRLNVSLASSGQSNQDIPYTYSGGISDRDYNYQSNTFVAKLSSDSAKTWSYKIGLYYDDNDSNDFPGPGKQSLTPLPGQDFSNTDSDLAMLKFDVKYLLSDHSSLSLETYSWEQNCIIEQQVTPTRTLRVDGTEHRETVKLVYRNDKLTDNTQLSTALAVRHDKIEQQRRRIFDATTTYVDEDVPFSGLGRRIDSLLLDAKTAFADKKWIIRYGFCLDDYSDFGSQLTPRLGVIYKLDNQSALKVLYGNSFRAANAVEAGGSPFVAGSPDIKPEELDTYELVYLKQTKDVKIEVVLFTSDWTNGITATDTNNDGFDDTFANVTDNKAYGLEVTYLKKLDNWLFESSGSYVTSKSETDNTDYVAFPKYILNLGIGYDFSSDWSLICKQSGASRRG